MIFWVFLFVTFEFLVCLVAEKMWVKAKNFKSFDLDRFLCSLGF